MLLLAVLACTKSDDGPTYTDDTADTYVEWPDDTGDTGTDNDGDGWSVEEGDCDDDDVYAHPGWEESDQEGNDTDGKDNDCDGYIDETFRGLIVLQQGRWEYGSKSQIVKVSPFGEKAAEIVFDDNCIQPWYYLNMAGQEIDFYFYLAPDVSGSGWVVSGIDRCAGDTAGLFTVSPSGETGLLADLSDGETFAQGTWGLTTHPDGYYLLTTLDGLWKIDPLDGEMTQVWSTIEGEGDDAVQFLLAFDVAVDELTGEIGVYGYWGGFATLDPETWEATVLRRAPTESVEHVNWSGAYWDARGGWFVGGQDADGWAVKRMDESTGDWIRKASFNEAWTPSALAIDTVYGEYYMSARGAQYPVVWELDAPDGTAPSQFYASDKSGTEFQDMWDMYAIFFD
jgi:hypothetical protein